MLGDHLVFPILLSKDLDATRAFYNGVLGLEILRDDGERIVFRCGSGSQVSLTLSTVGTADTQTQLAWRVPDIHAEPRGPARPERPHRVLRRARPRHGRGWHRRHGLCLGRLVHRSERPRTVDRPAEVRADPSQPAD